MSTYLDITGWLGYNQNNSHGPTISNRLAWDNFCDLPCLAWSIFQTSVHRSDSLLTFALWHDTICLYEVSLRCSGTFIKDWGSRQLDLQHPMNGIRALPHIPTHDRFFSWRLRRMQKFGVGAYHKTWERSHWMNRNTVAKDIEELRNLGWAFLPPEQS